MIRLLLLSSITFMLAACVQVMSYDSTVQEEAEPVDSLLVLIAAQGYRSSINAEDAFCRRFVERSALDRCASATAKTDVGTEIDDTRLRQLAAEQQSSHTMIIELSSSENIVTEHFSLVSADGTMMRSRQNKVHRIFLYSENAAVVTYMAELESRAEHSPSDANYFSRLGDRILKDLKEKNLIN